MYFEFLWIKLYVAKSIFFFQQDYLIKIIYYKDLIYMQNYLMLINYVY